jgi:hypothetical protein
VSGVGLHDGARGRAEALPVDVRRIGPRTVVAVGPHHDEVVLLRGDRRSVRDLVDVVSSGNSVPTGLPVALSTCP